MLMAAQYKSNKDLAAYLNISDRAAQRRRHGELEFTLSEIEKLAPWLNVEPEALMSGRGLEVPTALAAVGQ